MSLPNIVLVDIDHTVADAFWRDHIIPSLVLREKEGESAWDQYHEAADRDLPNKNVLLLLQRLYTSGYELMGLTARPEKWRAQTMRWCARHGVPLGGLLMRPEGNFDPSPLCKATMALNRFQMPLSDKIAFVLEDRLDVANEFRNLEVVVLQVHISDRDAMSVPFVEAV